jgi:hypothetical protein
MIVFVFPSFVSVDPAPGLCDHFEVFFMEIKIITNFK